MYEQRVRDIEMGSFTPLVFSTYRGMGSLSTTVFKRLASLLTAQHDQPYSFVMAYFDAPLVFPCFDQL